MISREKLAKAAGELSDHLRIVDDIRALQTAQKELADAVKALGDRVWELQADMRALKAETKFEALKETQAIVNAVQGGLNQRIETLSNKVAVIEAQSPRPTMSGSEHRVDGRGSMPRLDPPSG